MHNPQVSSEHYVRFSYLKKERWMNFWYQIDGVRCLGGKTVLEVGKGNGLVSETLAKLGLQVKTLDIDERLAPDFTGSVSSVPAADASFDVVLAAEVLEHLPWKEVPRALAEIRRVSVKGAVITLPYPGTILAGAFKAPGIRWVRFIFKLPHFWKHHAFTGEHYWELGKKGYSLSSFRIFLHNAGFSRIEESMHEDDPGRYRFIVRP